MYLWVGPDVGVAAVTEAAARAAARAAQLNRRGSSTRVRESYEEAGRRVGRMMCKYEPCYRGCDLVQVPVNEHPSLALAKGANPTSLAARFWRTLGEEIGSTKGIDALRNARPRKRWSEDEDNGVVAYVDEASSARLALTGVETVHEGVEPPPDVADANDGPEADDKQQPPLAEAPMSPPASTPPASPSRSPPVSTPPVTPPRLQQSRPQQV